MKSDEVVSFTVRLPLAAYERLAVLAKREFSSLNREVNIAVRAHLDVDKMARTKR